MSISATQTHTWIQTKLLSLIPSIKLPNPFDGKFSLSWRDNVVLAGIALAVANIAMSFFLGFVAAGVSFVALAALLIFVFYYVHNFNDGIALEKTVDTLKTDNQQLQATQKKMQSSADLLQRQYHDIHGINTQLNQTITSLQANTQRLQTANNTLALNSQQLQAQLNQLAQNKENLQKSISQIHTAIPLLKEQVAKFANQNISLGKNLNVLNEETIGINQETKQLATTINGLDMRFDQDILELSHEIQRAQAISLALFSGLKNQKEELNKQVSSLKSSAGTFKKLEEALKIRTDELNKLQIETSEKTKNLQNIENQIKQTKNNLEKTKNDFTIEIEKLKAAQSNRSTEEAKIEETKKQLQAFPQKLKEAELQLQYSIKEIEQEQQKDLKAIEDKIEQKIELAKQKNLELKDLDRQIKEKTELLHKINNQTPENK